MFLEIFEALEIFINKFVLKWEKAEGHFESSIFFEAQKYSLFLNRGLIFSNGHIRNVVSTFPNVVKIDVEIHKVVSTLMNVVNFNVDVNNVVSTLT